MSLAVQCVESDSLFEEGLGGQVSRRSFVSPALQRNGGHPRITQLARNLPPASVWLTILRTCGAPGIDGQLVSNTAKRGDRTACGIQSSRSTTPLLLSVAGGQLSR